ncbi:hypothetical protein HAX54_027028 [Datura stramonium]|uniref:Uncharacterized protein n=1 Tax=Datura stramonium TaxID=4076 RepID=A0ABS8V209_DATST|nr:hypothetical protein [Datura stramonium]
MPQKRVSPPPQSSQPSGHHRLVEMKNSHESQLQHLAKSLPELIDKTIKKELKSLRGPIDDLFEGLGDDFSGLGDANSCDGGEAEVDDEEE